jgi:hypothetical protein
MKALWWAWQRLLCALLGHAYPHDNATRCTYCDKPRKATRGWNG